MAPTVGWLDQFLESYHAVQGVLGILQVHPATEKKINKLMQKIAKAQRQEHQTCLPARRQHEKKNNK